MFKGTHTRMQVLSGSLAVFPTEIHNGDTPKSFHRSFFEVKPKKTLVKSRIFYLESVDDAVAVL